MSRDLTDLDTLLEHLPLEADRIIEGLRPWVECESPTYDADAVARMMDLVAYDCAEMGLLVERIPARGGVGPSVRAVLPHPRAGTPGILVSGHFDTVHPVGTLEQNPFRVEGDRLYGPGVLDMKSGNFIALEALRALLASGITPPLPVTFLFTPDEEIGTPVTRALIEAEARRNRYVLCPEPAVAGNGVTTGRYAIARYEISAVGQPSHAGAKLSAGVSAVRELAHRIIEIEGMTSDSCTFSVNDVTSGQWVNCVPSHARAQVLSMAKTQEDLDSGTARMLAMAGTRNGVRFEVRETVTRPVWENNRPETMALYEQARTISEAMGLPLPSASTGGGSDANFTGALGIASLCSLGPAGDMYHTLEEHLLIPTLVPRARLLAGLFATLTD
ncbi:M20/M25/M40 family metallo-hydrolase [Pseudooceanicola sp. CBS1P-1]|uniref:M20/M25/M40 family metallo-hydrolase n=1 Tax=Pseudooceanicola albus TaxID=2692189 RepID=A0A6L7G0K3_9RHOB|nr:MULTISPECIES: M20/M25/M40 family metallo-hydrolase [Pseudooceanicola]MBT9383751.1 M20/M25/M40 family metallo-hydrolase [Pseudooceanicola endophyticus]MXN17605.1 M20/M25/M40 family metallo-hydrolase [Pseudooceanicola albus]